MLKKSNKTKFRTEYPADYQFDFKDPVTLSKFVIESGKIVPSRISKLSSYQQRSVTSAIKTARSVALVPVGSDAYDKFQAEHISPKPFKFD